MKHYQSFTSTTPSHSKQPFNPKADTTGTNKSLPSNPSKPTPLPKTTPKVPPPLSSDTPKPHRELDEEKVSTMMTALRNTSDKHKYLLDLKSEDNYKFNSLETLNACTRLQCYPLWNAVARGIAPPPSNASIPSAPSPATRCVQINEPPTDININEQVQQVIQSALGNHGTQLLEELQSLELSNARNEEETNNLNSNKSKHNIGPHFHCPFPFAICSENIPNQTKPQNTNMHDALIKIMQKYIFLI
jgi:hypothetical protein